MKRYSWSFNEHTERWYNDSESTVDDCKAMAEEANADIGYEHDIVYIGETVAFVPIIDSASLLEQIQEQASECAGETGDDWDAYNDKKRDELDEKLTAVLHDWLKKYEYYPSLYTIENILPYKLDCTGDKE